MDRTHHRGSRAVIILASLAAMVAAALVGIFVSPGGASQRARAQAEALWSAPVNLSVSGSASRPAIALAPGNVAHALWWDTLDGARYVRGVISGTQTLWAKPQPVPFLVGESKRDPSTNKVTLAPPAQLSMAADNTGAVHVTWLDTDRGLRYAFMPPNGRLGQGPRLTDQALASSMSIDISGTLRMAYVQSSQAPGSPAGVYYVRRSGGAIQRTLVYSSTYFRTADPGSVSVAVAADGIGNVIVAWRQSPEDQAQFARSADNGLKWSAPQPIAAVSELFGIATQVGVAVTPAREFLLIWRDSTAPGCGMTQRRSSDGGQTWSPPERVLSDLKRCPARWAFTIGSDGKLWFIGTPASEAPLSDTNGVLAAWDGSNWSKPADIQLGYQDSVTQRTRILGCLHMALAGGSLAAIGCDVRGDVWSLHSVAGLERFLPVEQVSWDPPINLSAARTAQVQENEARRATTETTQHVAIATDRDGQIYALWSRADSAAMPANRLDIAVFKGDRFLSPAAILRVDRSNAGADPNAAMAKLDAPSLAVNANANTLRLHLVWSGGPSGRPFYSRAFARDANVSSGWAQPQPLPALTPIGGAPDIVADPRGQLLYVIYTIPFNELRGVYLVRSEDDGNTWSEPILVADGAIQNWDAVDQPRIALDPANETLHAVWLQTVLPGTTGSRAVYYARSLDRGKTWSAPLLVAQGDVDAPRVALTEPGVVVLTWNLTHRISSVSQTSNTWYQVSGDGGARWSQPMPVPGFENVTGGSALAGDQSGQLYLTALSTGSGGQARLLFTQWRGQGWGPVDEFSMGQTAVTGNTAAGALVARSGLLQLVMRLFELKPDGTGVWESVAISRRVAPVELTPLPTFTPLPPPAPTPTPILLPTEVSLTESVPTTLPLEAPESSPLGANLLLISAGIAAIVVVTGAVIGLMLMRRR
ncbi:MAG: hypothetical protein KatS3mg053_2386 [Candidatus Roseilinea sp.]|nr:MAG: hypothetical protein KatS3mg053_2386 [Candidatus Roseilinea sp.]